MSWGPRAKSNYRGRKIARRAMMREYRKKHSANSYAAAPPRRAAFPAASRSSTPIKHSQSRLIVTSEVVVRDRRYFDVARTVFFLTLALVLFVLFLMPVMPSSAVFCFFLGVFLVPEAIVCFIYRGQLRQSEALCAARELSYTEKDVDSLQAEFEELNETQWQEFLARQKQQTVEPLPTAAEISPTAATTVKPTPQVGQGQAFKSAHQRQREYETRVDDEMRWRRDMKHGKLPHEYNATDEKHQQEMDDYEHSILHPDYKERQIQELERKVQEGLPARRQAQMNTNNGAEAEGTSTAASDEGIPAPQQEVLMLKPLPQLSVGIPEGWKSAIYDEQH